jgi:hypothetical protein
MNWFQIALNLFQLAPQVLALIAAAEAAVGAGNGAAKKAIVMAPLAAAPTELQSAASTMVDSIVAEKKKVTP